MNAIDNIERTLEEWGENLRGGTSVQGLQPKDVLHKVLSSLEANRIEGLDHKVYAPNAYTVQLNLDDTERSRLMPFIGHEELEAAIQRYCQERKYQFRGPLALEVIESHLASQPADYPADLDPRGTRPNAHRAGPEKVLVQSRFDVPQNWESDLSRQFSAAPPIPKPITEHDLERRTPPTYADSAYKS